MKQSSQSVAKDLEDLGLILLDYMEMKSRRSRMEPHKIRAFREQNQVFGLSNAEKWSGNKQLVDFIDDLFNINTSRKPQVKLLKRVGQPIISNGIAPIDGWQHDYVRETPKDSETMRFLAELTHRSCFRLEQPVESR